MNEKDLKSLFIKSVLSGHLDKNVFFPEPAHHKLDTIIKNEGYFRNFDLVIAVIKKRTGTNIIYDSIESYDKYYNILMRTGVISQFARTEKCRIDWIRLYPVELKSDNDVLDDRLPNQILNAILTFGRSVVVLDERHYKKAKELRLAFRLLPATIIGYTGSEDRFEIFSVFERVVTNAIFSIQKKRLVKILHDRGIKNKTDKIYQCIANIQRLTQKLAFSELYQDNISVFLEKEIEFIQRLVDVPQIPSEKKLLSSLIAQTSNQKLTDYF
jgi:hypothetical protein